MDGAAFLPLTEKKRKEIQHDMKIFTEQYFKSLLGKGLDVVRVQIFEDLVVIRGIGFLTCAELNIAKSSVAGANQIRELRMSLSGGYLDAAADKLTSLLGVKILQKLADVNSSSDFVMGVFVLDTSVYSY